jgi:hypothetical protein
VNGRKLASNNGLQQTGESLATFIIWHGRLSYLQWPGPLRPNVMRSDQQGSAHV